MSGPATTVGSASSRALRGLSSGADVLLVGAAPGTDAGLRGVLEVGEPDPPRARARGRDVTIVPPGDRNRYRPI